jgi:hypothetical protein
MKTFLRSYGCEGSRKVEADNARLRFVGKSVVSSSTSVL